MSKNNALSLEIGKVFFNHIYTIINESTYEEIKNSIFLKEFCHVQEKTNSSGNAKWTGIYLTGENTYIEFFRDTDKKELKEQLSLADIGIAFSVDREEEFIKISKQFRNTFPNCINQGLLTRNIDNNLIPWFYYLEFTNDLSMKPLLDTWIMAYHKDYFLSKKSNYCGSIGFTRREYNKNFNTVPYDENKLFKDIEEIILLLNDESKRKFIEQLKLLGYYCENIENYTVCSGPGIKFILQLSDTQTCKFVQISMSLNRKIDNIQIYKVGDSTINLENKTGTWTF